MCTARAGRPRHSAGLPAGPAAPPARPDSGPPGCSWPWNPSRPGPRADLGCRSPGPGGRPERRPTRPAGPGVCPLLRPGPGARPRDRLCPRRAGRGAESAGVMLYSPLRATSRCMRWLNSRTLPGQSWARSSSVVSGASMRGAFGQKAGLIQKVVQKFGDVLPALPQEAADTRGTTFSRNHRAWLKRPFMESSCKSRWEAETSRKSTGRPWWLPTGVTTRSSKTRSRRTWNSGLVSPISSRNRVPPWAAAT